MKAKQPNVEDSAIEEVVKEELTQGFNDITPKGGRILLKEAGILILSEWDIANAIVFDSVRREGQARFRTEEDIQIAHNGVKFSADHKALVLWSVQDKKDTHTQETANKVGSLMVYRVGETSGTEAALMTQQVGDFNLQVALKEQKKLEEVIARLDKAMDAYNQKLKEIADKDILIANLQKQLGKRPQVEVRPMA